MRTDDEKTDETNYSDTESDATVNALPTNDNLYNNTSNAMQQHKRRRGWMLGIHGMDHI